MLAHCEKVTDGSGTAKALDYSLKWRETLCCHEPDPVREAERARSLGLFEGLVSCLPAPKNTAIEELSPHNWQTAIADEVAR